MKILYGLLFTVILPLGTALWSECTVITTPEAPFIPLELSLSLATVGILIMGWSMLLLRTKGGGLPMTIAPPERLVTTGPYAVVRHPIYLGFLLAWIGVALWQQAAGMFWVGTPMILLGIWAILKGYEHHAHTAHFGGERHSPLLSVPRIALVDGVWTVILKGADAIANSWREWHLGRFRLINHGLYAGAATVVGMLLVSWLLPTGSAWDVVIVAVCAVIGAGAWAQIVEGNSGLLRPFGFYGGVIGGCLAILVIGVSGRNGWGLAAAFATAAPFIQAIGRGRCLVQGCCHGAPHPEGRGLHYHTPKSRVTAAGLANVPLYATPVYSMLTNLLLTAPVLLLFWMMHQPASVILGTSLALNSFARFVEEAYRGEPQTPTFAGLRLYQWIALIGILIGMGLMMIPSPTVVVDGTVSSSGIAVALALGLLTTVAMGVDLPSGTTRFSRLTP